MTIGASLTVSILLLTGWSIWYSLTHDFGKVFEDEEWWKN